jgi:hypothetical protein
LLSLQVAERINRRAGTGDENRAIVQVNSAPDQPYNPELGMSANLRQRTHASEIVRPIAQVSNGSR